MNCLLVLSLAVLGASAAPCSLNFGASTASTACGQALPGKTIFAQTPVIENPTSVFPGCLPQASVSQSCHCLKTIVRPQIRNEIITVPQIDRIVRVVPSPVVEAVSVNLGGNTRTVQLPTCGFSSGSSGISGGVVDGVSGDLSSVVSYPRIVEGGVIGTSGIVGNSGFIGTSGIVGNSGFIGTSGCGCGSNIIV